jgi:hypothetical protein
VRQASISRGAVLDLLQAVLHSCGKVVDAGGGKIADPAESA